MSDYPIETITEAEVQEQVADMLADPPPKGPDWSKRLCEGTTLITDGIESDEVSCDQVARVRVAAWVGRDEATTFTFEVCDAHLRAALAATDYEVVSWAPIGAGEVA